MAEKPTLIEDHFALKHFSAAMARFRPPTEAFDPGGAWTSTYEVVECAGLGANAGRAWRIGVLVLEREPLGRDRVRLRLDFRKRAAGGGLHLSAEIECRADALATPLSWKQESEVLDAAGTPIEDLRLAESGSAGRDSLTVTVGAIERRVPAAAPFTTCWSLFDAIQRLPREKTPEQRFTLVDRLDHQVKPGQLLAFRKSATVLFGSKVVWGEEAEALEAGTRYRPVPRHEGGAAVSLWVYEQVGEGILPTTYWVDERGRLLFVLSGLNGFIYNAEARL